MMTCLEARGILEREVADMDESELRTALMIVARHMGEDRALPLVLSVKGSGLPDAEEIGRTIVRAIEGSDDDFAMECCYERDYDGVESPEESASRHTSAVCDAFSDMVEDLTEAGRAEEASALLLGIASELRKVHGWHDVEPWMTELAGTIGRCVAEGRLTDALRYRSRSVRRNDGQLDGEPRPAGADVVLDESGSGVLALLHGCGVERCPAHRASGHGEGVGAHGMADSILADGCCRHPRHDLRFPSLS